MPRYFFTVSDGSSVAIDSEGSDLADLEQAQAEALGHVRHLLAQSDERGKCRRHWVMYVSDAAGAEVFKLPFGHALEADHLSATRRHDLG